MHASFLERLPYLRLYAALYAKGLGLQVEATRILGNRGRPTEHLHRLAGCKTLQMRTQPGSQGHIV